MKLINSDRDLFHWVLTACAFPIDSHERPDKPVPENVGNISGELQDVPSQGSIACLDHYREILSTRTE